MNSFTSMLVISALLISAHAVKIRTDVYCSRTGSDPGTHVEIQTEIEESGNGQSEAHKETRRLREETNFRRKFGVRIATATFSGPMLPSNMKVRVFEEGSSGRDDGVCLIDVNASFSSRPVSIKCTREANNGLAQTWVITAIIYKI